MFPHLEANHTESLRAGFHSTSGFVWTRSRCAGISAEQLKYFSRWCSQFKMNQNKNKNKKDLDQTHKPDWAEAKILDQNRRPARARTPTDPGPEPHQNHTQLLKQPSVKATFLITSVDPLSITSCVRHLARVERARIGYYAAGSVVFGSTQQLSLRFLVKKNK